MSQQVIWLTIAITLVGLFSLFTFLLTMAAPKNINARIDKLEKGVSNELGRQFDYIKVKERDVEEKIKKLQKRNNKLYGFQLIAEDEDGDLVITLDSKDIGMLYPNPSIAAITGQFIVECMDPMGQGGVECEVYRYTDSKSVITFGTKGEES